MALTRSQYFVIVLVVLLILGGWLGYSRLQMPYAVERQDRIALSKIVTGTFGKTSALKVGTLTGEVQTTAADARLGGLLQSDSVMRAPYRVDYMVDLSALSLKDFMWDAGDRVLTIRVPEPVAQAPNIDEAKMTVERRGVFITRDAFDKMGRISAARAARIVQDKANSPEMLTQARANARSELARLIKAPLAAAGIKKAQVAVRFPADGTRANVERWDETRSLAQVYGDKNQ
jgi:Protein of unknown function (DUF4230)